MQGPVPELQMTQWEILSTLGELMEGLSLVAELQPEARLSWAYRHRIVHIQQPIFPDAP